MQRRISFLIVLFLTLFLVAACGDSEEAEPTAVPEVDPAPTSAPAVEEESTEPEPAPAEETEAYPAPAAVPAQSENYPAPAPTYNPYPEPDAETGAAAVAEPAAYPEPETERGAPVAAGATFQIVTEESQASYIVNEEFLGGAVTQLGKQLGLFTPVGVTEDVSGQLTLNLGEPPSLVSGDITVNIEQLTTDDERRDNRIRERFLESSKYPLATFVAKEIQEGPATFQDGQEVTFKLLGDLTVREVTKPTTFDVTAKLTGNTITGEATTTILMTDFGFDPPIVDNFMTVENNVLLVINLTARSGQ